MRRGGVLLTVWLVVAGLAIMVGTWALSLVGGEISDQTIAPLSDSQITQNLRADRAGDDSVAGNAVTPSNSLDVSHPGPHMTQSTHGGSVTATCEEGKSSVVMVPRQGYRSEDDAEGRPAPFHHLTFEPEQAGLPEIKVQVWCVRNVPQFDVKSEPHDGTQTGNPSAQPTPSVTDDRGGGTGGHGADDGATDDHNRRGAGSGSGGSGGGG